MIGVESSRGLKLSFPMCQAMVAAPWETPMVYPSGGFVTTKLGPTVPPPPALFSQMMGWPRYFLAPLARARAVKSVEPPGGYGITNMIGFVGYSAAIAG